VASEIGASPLDGRIVEVALVLGATGMARVACAESACRLSEPRAAMGGT